ncbi:hypothetical protein [Flaviaesturariibacter terrae]
MTDAVPFKTLPKSFSRRLLRLALVNLLLVALLGVVLRAVPFLAVLPFDYHNLLHAHSHFAFGGWVQPALLALLLQRFPELRERVSRGHWYVLSALLFVSAWGMLLTFPLQGYGPASITFSTISLGAGFYWAVLCYRALRGLPDTAARRFLRAGFGWLMLSAAGPFATGPITAAGGLGSPLYYDVIYGYLHFQYNGFFSFLVLALLYRSLERDADTGFGRRSFPYFQAAVLPTYALSLLWNSPPLWVHVIGGAGALLQIAGFAGLLRDVKGRLGHKPLVVVSLAALGLKLSLQLLSTLPAIALLAAAQRNFVIAYLHLVLLGFITLFVFGQLPQGRLVSAGVGLFLVSFVSTELMLAGAGFGWMLPNYPAWLLAASLPFPVSVLLLIGGTRAWAASGRGERTSKRAGIASGRELRRVEAA